VFQTPTENHDIRCEAAGNLASSPVWELVIQDMRQRDALGLKRYGIPLTANAGRNSLQDAYEECLDQVVYIKAALIERDAMVAEIMALRAERNEFRHAFEQAVKDAIKALLDEDPNVAYVAAPSGPGEVIKHFLEKYKRAKDDAFLLLDLLDAHQADSGVFLGGEDAPLLEQARVSLGDRVRRPEGSTHA
jgi:hypothetical protein